MNFSASQWLAGIVIDVLVKFLLLTGVGLFVTFGLIPLSMLLTPVVALSLLHFFCLFLGTSSVAGLELFGIRPSPMLRCIVGVVIANILFMGVLVVLLWPGPNDVPGTADGPVIVAFVLASTNLIALLSVIAWARLIRRIRRWVRPG